MLQGHFRSRHPRWEFQSLIRAKGNWRCTRVPSLKLIVQYDLLNLLCLPKLDPEFCYKYGLSSSNFQYLTLFLLSDNSYATKKTRQEGCGYICASTIISLTSLLICIRNNNRGAKKKQTKSKQAVESDSDSVCVIFALSILYFLTNSLHAA